MTSRIRELVLQRDGLTCQRCGLFVDDEDYEIEQVIPGSDALSNLRVVHPRCLKAEAEPADM